MLGGFRERLDLSRLVEWTIEANPGSVSPRKAALLRDVGVTRISLGVQSWDDDLLGLLGREHNAAQAEESFQILRDGRTHKREHRSDVRLARTIARAMGANARTNHRASAGAYFRLLPDLRRRHRIFSPPRARRISPGRIERRAFFRSGDAVAGSGGYQQYEISNYARPGYESAHNRGYWAGDDYLGIGPSAFSTVGDRRWQNVCDYRAYSDRILGGESPISSTETLSARMKRAEQIALGLRTREWRA